METKSEVRNQKSDISLTILHVITRLIVGGAQQNTIACCAAQVAAGHKVWLAYGPIYGPEGSLLAEAEKSGAELVEVPSLLRAVSPVQDLACYQALRRLVRRIEPDVVHTHSSKAGILGRAAAWNPSPASLGSESGRPAIVHTVHGLPFHDRQPWWEHALYVRLERWAARRCDKIIGVTQAMIDAFQKEKIGHPDQFTVVPSGVDVTAFSPPPPEVRIAVRQRLSIEPDAPVIGIVARLDKLKGQDDLLDVLPALIPRHPGVRLLIVGDGWTRKALEERVNKEKLGGRVIFTGLVPPGDVAELLGAMDVSVLPSYQEGQPRTLVQSLLCGCAIVGYDAGGIGEVCINGQTGRLVPVGDRVALGEAIAELLGNPAERMRLAERGRRFAVERFDLRGMVERVEEVYRDALSRKRR